MVNIGNIAATLSLNNRPMAATLGRSEQMLRSFARRTVFYLTVLVGGVSGLLANEFMKFEEAMRNVNTIAKQNETQFLQTSDAVLQLAREFGRVPIGLAQALYDINSASFTAARGLEVLRASTVAARAGLSTTREAARAIVGALNAYALSSQHAADISDTMFATVKFGVLTFGDLAGSLGIAVSTAAAAKVPFDQLAAAAATMTRGGIQVREAFTALNRVMLRIIQNRGNLAKVFATTVEGSGAAMLRVRGLAGTMEFLQKVTLGDTEAMVALGFMVRDLKAALSLTRNEGRDYAMDIERIANQNARAGATTEAFMEQTKALSFQFALLKSEVVVAAINIGRVLSPAIREVVGDTTSLIKNFNDLGASFTAWGKNVASTTATIKMLFQGLWILLKFTYKFMELGIQVVGENVATGVYEMIDRFTVLFKWLQKNWKAVLTNIGSGMMTFLENMGKNIVTFVKNIPGLVSGKVKWGDLLMSPLLEGMQTIKLDKPEFGKFEYRNMLEEMGALGEEYNKAIEDLGKAAAGPAAEAAGRVADINRIRIGGVVRPSQSEMRRMGEEYARNLANAQQKTAMTPQGLNIGATTIEKGSVAAFRAERGLKDPKSKAAEETSANAKKIAEVLARAEILKKRITEVQIG